MDCLIELAAWKKLAREHLELIVPYADAYVKRRSVGIKHPVHDFLFTYYTCSPGKLKQWVPAFTEALIFPESERIHYPWLDSDWFIRSGEHLVYRKDRIKEHVLFHASFIKELCSSILHRTARFGCFGLHEWAMVYRLKQDEIRHSGYRLRLSMDEINSFVERQTLCCSHYDAYRFFTVEARPLNILQPSLDTRLETEQGGCVHANMDLYKWAVKLWPWIGSEFIRRTFFLALEARELDMRASPYDLLEDGYTPIRIETEEGRKLYQAEQMALAEKATTLRRELANFCDRLVDYASE